MDERLRFELALAVLLWKFWRHETHTADGGSGVNQWLPTASAESVAEDAMELAKAAGVKDEFLELLFAFPVLKIEVRELEKWASRKKSPSNFVSSDWRRWLRDRQAETRTHEEKPPGRRKKPKK